MSFNSSAVPQFHEKRTRLDEMVQSFTEFIGGYEVIDIAETIRVMLGDYFYGEPVIPAGRTFYTDQDRTLVFPMLRGQTLQGIELTNAIDLLGEIFWTLTDNITNRMLAVTPTYAHRPSDCFYKFFPATLELVVYTPVLDGVVYPLELMPLDGRAVIAACSDTLPSWLRQG